MEKDLRLRLVVRRHGVPDVKLLWNVTTNEDFTISKLVAQVNDVVPLESGEWGFEDYAVELKDASGEGFECVHYHLVSKVLKDDDQVLIRPLLTDDLKRRRLSGRHQISSDGKHLVDGLAYGRAWLKAPRDRPVVALPPRKKARIAYSSEDEYDSPFEYDDNTELPMIECDSNRAQEYPSSVKLRACFYDAESEDDDEDDEFESDTDEDEEEMDVEDGDLQDELRLLKEDNATVREGNLLDELRNIRGQRASGGTRDAWSSSPYSDSPVASASNALVRSGTKVSHKAQLDMDSLDKISALRAAFPSAPISAVEKSLLRCSKNSEQAYRKLRKSFKPQLGIRQMLDRQERSLSSSPIRHSERNEGRELVLRETSPSEQASVSAANQSHDGEDDYLDDVASESNEDSETLNHNTQAASKDTEDEAASESDSDASVESRAASSDSESDEEMSDADENAKGQSDDDADVSSSKGSGGEMPSPEDDGSDDADQEDKSSSEDGSGSDDSDSDVSSIVGTKTRVSTRTAAKFKSLSESSESSSDDDSDDSPSDSSSGSSSEESSSDESSSDSEPEEIPTKTLSNTQKLLEPTQLSPLTKASAAVVPGLEAPPVPPGQGLSKTQKRNARRKLAKQAAAKAGSASGHSREPSHQVPGGEDPDDLAALLARKKALLEAIVSDAPEEDQSQQKSPEIPDSAPQDTAPGPATGASQSIAAEEQAEQRRMKPNIGAARRMLMGSLGLKNPKTKADEDRIRQDLMQGVRPHTNARLTETSELEQSAQTQESVEEDPEAWREKITYRAVECCHEGVELSEPPFPFVQRWDPQQQFQGSQNQRGGKRKRVQRNQAHFYEDGDSQSSKKRRLTGGNSAVTFSDAVGEGDTTLNYDDPVEEPHVPKVQAEGSQATDNDDLPSLPKDPNTLPKLQPGDAKVGMVITWKQWTLSTATNWQPEIHDVTGILVRIIDEEATELEIILARRDRDLDKSQKVYDESTGQRIYDRFEAPDDDDEEDNEDVDEGFRKLAYADLMDPRILQYPLDDNEKPHLYEESSAPTDSVIHETIYGDQSQSSLVNGEKSSRSELDVGSQSHVDAEDGQTKANTDDGQPQDVADNDGQLPLVASNVQPTRVTDSPADDGVEENLDEEDVPTPKASAHAHADHRVQSTEDSQESAASQVTGALSISSDRRHEISLMIAEDGFRKDISPSVMQRKTSSPSRQLLEQMSEAANTTHIHSKTPLSETSVAKEDTPIPPHNDAAVPPSSASSIRSGRQPDADFSFEMGGDDLPQMGETGDGSPLLGASTPKASVQTPERKEQFSAEPSTGNSFPSLERIFLIATSQPNTRDTDTPSKSQVFSDIKSRKSIVKNDAEYESAMRRVDEEESEESKESEESEEEELPRAFKSTRKQLFPNSSQPAMSRSPELPDMKPISKTAPSSFNESQDIKRLLRTRKRSPFVIPAGSQVIALSSSRSNSPAEEDYAEDEIDEDYEENSSSLPHGSGWVQKNKPPRKNTRAKSMPAAKTTTEAGGGRGSVPSSTAPVKSSNKSHKSISKF